MSNDVIRLAAGDNVPKYLVDALTEFEDVWPGATFHLARPAIVGELLHHLEKHMSDHIYKTMVEELKMSEDDARIFSVRLSKRLVK